MDIHVNQVQDTHTHTGTTVMQTACNIIVMTIVGYVRYRVVLGNNLAS